MAEQLRMYIDGTWVDARDGARFDTTDPATGAVLASLPRAGADDVAVAVAAARRAFDDGTWGSAAAERDRARLLFRMADLVRSQATELAELDLRDCGKPIADARYDIDEVAFMFEYYAGRATKIAGDIPPVGQMIQRTCADQLKRVTMELGGKSPNIVFDDAALDRAIPGTSMGIFGNQGEVCSAGSRVFVHRTIYDDVCRG